MRRGYCRRHPSMRLLSKKQGCTFCEDWATGPSFVGTDQAFHFMTQGVHPKLPAGLQVTSLKQFDRLCKRYGVTADLSLKERINRRTGGLAARAQQARRQALWSRARPLITNALRTGGMA